MNPGVPPAGVNSSFSLLTPGLQLAIDSTSLGTAKECMRKYYYRHIRGLVPRDTSVHLTFGILLHKAMEIYDHKRSQGLEHHEALRGTLRWAYEATWDRRLGRPWDSGHPEKNRSSLIRAIVWHLDKFNPDPCETILLANGKPAVELSFTFPSGMSYKGEEFVFCGHLDKLVRLGGDYVYVKDIKTTSRVMGGFFFDQFSPDNQMSLYAIAGKIVWAQPVEGLIVDGIQVAAGFVRSQRGLVSRTPAQLQEWFEEALGWVEGLVRAVELQRWPMNDKACHNYGGCPYRAVCGRSPEFREAELRQGFQLSQWDPLVRRGNPET